MAPYKDGSDWWTWSQNFIQSLGGSKPTRPLIFSNTNKLDPSDFVSACKILALSQECAKNREIVDLQYNVIKNDLLQRQAKLSGPLAQEFQLLINDVDTAYHTITKGKPQ